MPNQNYPTVNGHECSWADISVDIAVPGGQTIKLTDIEGIKHSSKVERAVSRGTSGGRPMKKTAGSATHEAGITWTRSGMRGLYEALAEAARAIGAVRGNDVIVSAVMFTVLIQHTPLGDTNVYATKLEGCSLDEDSEDLKQGNDADVIETALSPLDRKRKLSDGSWAVLR